MNDDLVTYYKQRANEYDRIYEKPERQPDLAEAAQLLQQLTSGRSVLEIACGTGYWTEHIAKTATCVTASDIASEVLEIARTKTYGPAPVTFHLADFYKLEKNESCDCLFGGFIWTHIRREEMDHFLNTVHALVPPGSKFVFMDNRFVEKSNTPLAETDEHGNTYQHRTLMDGSQFKVLKNFPSGDDLRTLFAGKVEGFVLHEMAYYWILEYTTPVQ